MSLFIDRSNPIEILYQYKYKYISPSLFTTPVLDYYKGIKNNWNR